MEIVAIILAVAFVVFLFGIYADSGSKSESQRPNIQTINYQMVKKG